MKDFHTLTCVSVKFNEAENSARSAIVKYCLSRNFFSNASNCDVVNGVRGLRFCLCLRNEHILALIFGNSLLPKLIKIKKNVFLRNFLSYVLYQ